MIKPSNRQIQFEQAIHTSSPEQLLIQAVLHPASDRHLVDRELDRRAHGDVPPAVCGRISPERPWRAAA